MKASMKIMAAGVVAVMLMAGIAGTLAYTASVVNEGNKADIKATEIGFFDKTDTTKECKPAEILRDIGTTSSRTYNATDKKWETTWTFEENTNLINNVVVKVMSGDPINGAGTFTVTITGVTVGSGSVAGTDFTATLGSLSTNDITITSGIMTVTFTGTIVISDSGTELSITAKQASADKFVGFSIASSTVTATFTSS